MKDERQIKGLCGAVVSLLLGAWLNLSPMMSGSGHGA